MPSRLASIVSAPLPPLIVSVSLSAADSCAGRRSAGSSSDRC